MTNIIIAVATIFVVDFLFNYHTRKFIDAINKADEPNKQNNTLNELSADYELKYKDCQEKLEDKMTECIYWRELFYRVHEENRQMAKALGYKNINDYKNDERKTKA